MKKEFLLIDSHALIHRAFHALPPLTTPDGKPIGAVYGLTRALIKTLKDHNPDYVAAAFDRPEETFRKSKFSEYKANRPKAPDELISQFEIARNLFSVLSIPVVDKPGFEADDIIGTLAEKFASEDVHITILTGDLDSLQLVRDGFISVKTPQKGLGEMKEYTENGVFEKLGVHPNRVVDYKGLVGDASDNIPGISGVGPKTALKLLSQFSTVEDIFKNENPADPLLKKIILQKDIALLSKYLATIKKDITIEKSLSDFIYHPIEENPNARTFFSTLGFKNLLPEKMEEEEKDQIKTSPVLSYSDIEDESCFYAAFDWKQICKDCIKEKIQIPKNIFDISIMCWLLDPDAPKSSYTQLVKKYLKKDAVIQDKESIQQLASIFIQKLKKEELFSIYTQFEMPLIPLLAKMEYLGIKTNKSVLIELKKEIIEKLSNLEKEIIALAGIQFNISSPKQVGETLQELGVFGKTKKTKTGQIKTDKETLESVSSAHPIVEKILLYREYAKIHSGFVEPLLSISSDEIIHTTYLQTGTGTGRLSSEKPNLQNIPQESVWSKQIRNSFVSRETHTFLSFDYSQLELRLLAHESKDTTLIQAFNENKDIHSITASKIFNKTPELVTKQERRIGKTLNFGVIYGMGPRAFSKTSGVSIEEAKKFMTEYFTSFPAVSVWQEKIKESAKRDGYVKNVHGRRRLFSEDRFQELERAIINMPLQSFGADIMKKSIISVSSLIETEGYSNTVFPLLTIHDELLLEVKNDIINVISTKIKQCMEGVEHISVPLVVDVKVGTLWGSMESFPNTHE
ncbi:MAG: DNA polymerase I [Parcubacteria group bacterium LiPW_41]|nr:MAG: DNA polymerase I [Parcubacteria group bacterium LiPW_41]